MWYLESLQGLESNMQKREEKKPLRISRYCHQGRKRKVKLDKGNSVLSWEKETWKANKTRTKKTLPASLLLFRLLLLLQNEFVWKEKQKQHRNWRGRIRKQKIEDTHKEEKKENWEGVPPHKNKCDKTQNTLGFWMQRENLLFRGRKICSCLLSYFYTHFGLVG